MYKRQVNYYYNKTGHREINPAKWISLNSRFNLDNTFHKIENEIFIDDDLSLYKGNHIGFEDIRVYNYKGTLYYIACILDDNRKITSVTSDVYDIKNEEFKLNKKIIIPTFYPINKRRVEKNWVFFPYKNELCVVYNWYPLQICKIDYHENKLNLKKINYDMDLYFKDTKGSSCGVVYNNYIWFILHKSQKNAFTQRPNCFQSAHHYQHFFAIFDLDMNLIRYTETFKLHEDYVEFCTGFIIKDDKMIISYGASDCKSFVSIYSLSYIKNELYWYKPDIN